jgi:nucleotide-binding universal stress UspA family protein
MQTIKQLLCAVDLSVPSAQALRYAAALRSAVDGDLTILHVRATGAGRPAAAASDTSLASFVADLIGPGSPMRLLERQGEPVREILDTAVTVAADVVVMGTHGRTGLERLLVGSVAERVIRRSSAPVLAVPARHGAAAPGPIVPTSVLCAVDFSEPSSSAVEYAAAIAASAGARLVLAHALEWSEETETIPASGRFVLPSSEDDAIDRLSGLVTDDVRVRCDPEFVVGYGTPADEIRRVAQERRVDLVVLGMRRRNPIDLAVFGSTTRQVIRDGRYAVLTVRTGETLIRGETDDEPNRVQDSRASESRR